MNNVLQAKLNLDNAGLSLLQAKSQQLDAIVEVYQALWLVMLLRVIKQTSKNYLIDYILRFV